MSPQNNGKMDEMNDADDLNDALAEAEVEFRRHYAQPAKVQLPSLAVLSYGKIGDVWGLKIEDARRVCALRSGTLAQRQEASGYLSQLWKACEAARVAGSEQTTAANAQVQAFIRTVKP